MSPNLVTTSPEVANLLITLTASKWYEGPHRKHTQVRPLCERPEDHHRGLYRLV
jgi:hypothetical protein